MNVLSYKQKDVADVIELSVLRGETILNGQSEPNVITGALIRGGQEGRGSQREATWSQ